MVHSDLSSSFLTSTLNSCQDLWISSDRNLKQNFLKVGYYSNFSTKADFIYNMDKIFITIDNVNEGLMALEENEVHLAYRFKGLCC